MAHSTSHSLGGPSLPCTKKPAGVVTFIPSFLTNFACIGSAAYLNSVTRKPNSLLPTSPKSARVSKEAALLPFLQYSRWKIFTGFRGWKAWVGEPTIRKSRPVRCSSCTWLPCSTFASVMVPPVNVLHRLGTLLGERCSCSGALICMEQYSTGAISNVSNAKGKMSRNTRSKSFLKGRFPLPLQ